MSMLRLSLAALFLSACAGVLHAQTRNLTRKSQFRRPVGLALTADGKLLCVANRNSGTISLIDPIQHVLLSEHAVGKSLSSIAPLPDPEHVLVTDSAANELILLRVGKQGVNVLQRAPVPRHPQAVALSGSDRCFVTSLWDRSVSAFDLSTPEKPQLSPADTTRLDFAPHKLLPLADHAKLLVAGSFEARVALLDAGTLKVESVRSVPDHNLRGLALSPDGKRVLVAQQTLNEHAHTTQDDIHWGHLSFTLIRSLSLETVLDPQADLLSNSTLDRVSRPGVGAADPGGIIVDSKSSATLVALGGTDEVAIRFTSEHVGRRVSVGRRPTEIVLFEDARQAFVANTLSDSISVIDLPSEAQIADVPLGPTPEPSALERGEVLFLSSKLSHDRWISCQTCHTEGHTNNLVSDTLNDGSYRTPKRIPSLLGTANTAPWSWLGKFDSLETQARASIETSMHIDDDEVDLTDDDVRDLAAYILSLAPPPAFRPPVNNADRALIGRGRNVFKAQGCVKCHQGTSLTAKRSYDVGIHDSAGNKAFNPPSLVGVGHRPRFFHDGRTSSLEAVVEQHQYEGKKPLSPDELRALVRYLESL